VGRARPCTRFADYLCCDSARQHWVLAYRRIERLNVLAGYSRLRELLPQAGDLREVATEVAWVPCSPGSGGMTPRWLVCCRARLAGQS
jgi:hypothetical protein